MIINITTVLSNNAVISKSILSDNDDGGNIFHVWNCRMDSRGTSAVEVGRKFGQWSPKGGSTGGEFDGSSTSPIAVSASDGSSSGKVETLYCRSRQYVL